MALSSRTLAFLGAVVAVSAAVIQAATIDPVRIMAAANVTMRAMPSPGADAVAQLPLGTEVTEAGPAGLDKTWVRVRLGDGREGWVLSNLTRPLDPVWRWPVFDGIIADRLARKGDGFPARAELVAFIDRVLPEYTDPDGRARVELARLRALSAAAAAIPFRGDRREPYASWLQGQTKVVAYDEPGGRWMVSDRAAWDLQARHSASSSADEMAWFAVTNGLAGECEGFVTCYLQAHDRMHGEYLRRQPLGSHVGDAVAAIRKTVELLSAQPKPRTAFEFDPQRDCRDVTVAVDALASAMKATRAPDREAALGSLAAMKKMCQ